MFVALFLLDTAIGRIRVLWIIMVTTLKP